MAQMQIYSSEDAFDSLWNVNFADYAIEALNEAAPVLESRMKANARAGVMHEGDSEMVNSIKASKAKKAKTNAYIINVGPRGYSKTKVYTAKDGKGKRTTRSYPVSNALKAIWKEYGIPGRQPARPFISAAAVQCERQIIDILQKKFEDKVK